MWTELNSLVPKYLQEEIDRSRANVDFFVALFYLSAAFGIATLAGIAGSPNKSMLGAVAAVAFLSMYLWYRMAVLGTSYWSATVQALVNLGRTKLADELGLKIPPKIDEERAMWWLVTTFAYDNNDEAAHKLDQYRKPKDETKKGTESSRDTEAERIEQTGDEHVEMTTVVFREVRLE